MQKIVPGMVIVAVLIFLGAGCNKSTDEKTAPPTGSGNSQPNSQSSGQTPEAEKSAAAVRSFISAMLKGKDEQAFGLLSQKAQEEYKKYNRGFAFPANDETDFVINTVMAIEGSDNTAFGVAVTMTEKYPEGNKVTESSWGVRNENGKYCIVGVILNDEGLMMELNFEDLAGSEAKMKQQMEQIQQEQAKIATAPQEMTLPVQQQQIPQQQLGNGNQNLQISPDLQLPSHNERR